jgi:hypothetical protein
MTVFDFFTSLCKGQLTELDIENYVREFTDGLDKNKLIRLANDFKTYVGTHELNLSDLGHKNIIDFQYFVTTALPNDDNIMTFRRSTNLQPSENNDLKITELAKKYCKRPNSKYNEEEVYFILKKADQFKHQKNVSALIKNNIQSDNQCPDSIKDNGEFSNSKKHTKRQRKVIKFYDQQTGNKRK